MSNDVQRIHGGRARDTRGVVSYWNSFDFKTAGVRRAYVIENWDPGQVRAWHGHVKEAKYFVCLRGAVLICTLEKKHWGNALAARDVGRFVLAAEDDDILAVPAGHANGVKVIRPDSSVMVFSTLPVEESAEDMVRVPWDRFGTQIWELDNG